MRGVENSRQVMSHQQLEMKRSREGKRLRGRRVLKAGERNRYGGRYDRKRVPRHGGLRTHASMGTVAQS